MTVVDKKSALPDAYIGNNLSADIVLLPNGKYLYVSNRGANCVCVFEINEENGIPVLLQSVPTAGWPRALQFSENFKVLYILNEEYESSKGSLESYCVSRYGRLSDRKADCYSQRVAGRKADCYSRYPEKYGYALF